MLLITAYKETDKLQNKCISMPIAIVTVPVHHMCSVANQAWACDVDILSIVCIQ